MAGTVEHLAVALELIKKWGENQSDFQEERAVTLQNSGLFLAGNICPDGIMARKNYQRPMKMHTHFRDGIMDYEFHFSENLQIFHQRIRQFAHQNIKPCSENRDLYLGYLTHILTDEVFMLTIRPKFMEKIAPLGLTDRDAKTFEYFTYDVNQIDFRLAKEYPGMSQAYAVLKNSPPYEITGWITQEELTDSRTWILDFFFEKAPEPEMPVFYTYKEALQFISDAVDIIDKRVLEHI